MSPKSPCLTLPHFSPKKPNFSNTSRHQPRAGAFGQEIIKISHITLKISQFVGFWTHFHSFSMQLCTVPRRFVHFLPLFMPFLRRFMPFPPIFCSVSKCHFAPFPPRFHSIFTPFFQRLSVSFCAFFAPFLPCLGAISTFFLCSA